MTVRNLLWSGIVTFLKALLGMVLADQQSLFSAVSAEVFIPKLLMLVLILLAKFTKVWKKIHLKILGRLLIMSETTLATLPEWELIFLALSLKPHVLHLSCLKVALTS
jgi:hypothetical protein